MYDDQYVICRKKKGSVTTADWMNATDANRDLADFARLFGGDTFNPSPFLFVVIIAILDLHRPTRNVTSLQRRQQHKSSTAILTTPVSNSVSGVLGYGHSPSAGSRFLIFLP